MIVTYAEVLSKLKAGRQVRRVVWHRECRAVLIDGEICQKLNGVTCAIDNIDKAMTDWELA